MNCFSSSLPVEVCDHTKGINKGNFLKLFFFSRGNEIKLYQIRKLNQTISLEG